MQKNRTNTYPKKDNRTITNQPYSMRDGNYDAFASGESPFDKNRNGFFLNFLTMLSVLMRFEEFLRVPALEFIVTI